MTIETYLTSDMQASLDDIFDRMTVESYGVSWTIDICPHCDGAGILGYCQSAGGVIEDVCSACRGRGVLVDVGDVDGIPF